MHNIRPMLAAKTPEDLSTLRFPLYASPKLDGVRCLIIGGKAVSRTLKPIRNQFVSQIMSNPAYEGFDGELIVGHPTDDDVYRNTNSGVMREQGEPAFRFYVFDNWFQSDEPFLARYHHVSSRLCDRVSEHVLAHEHYVISSLEELLSYEQQVLARGYEGVITRAPAALYKRGRSTAKEQGMVKIKRFSDDEAEIIGVEELMSNQNEAMVNALGYTERSSHKANQEPMGVLGALVVRRADGVEFKIGTGFDATLRQHLWMIRDSLGGRLVKYKYFEVGVKDKPRHPVFLGFRNTSDL